MMAGGFVISLFTSVVVLNTSLRFCCCRFIPAAVAKHFLLHFPFFLCSVLLRSPGICCGPGCRLRCRAWPRRREPLPRLLRRALSVRHRRLHRLLLRLDFHAHLRKVQVRKKNRSMAIPQ